MDACDHIDAVPREGGILGPPPSSDGCTACLESGSRWVTLRRCLTCGTVACCDSSPNRHASAHARETGHPLIQSFEPRQDWIWCYVDEVTLELPEGANSPSHP